MANTGSCLKSLPTLPCYALPVAAFTFIFYSHFLAELENCGIFFFPPQTKRGEKQSLMLLRFATSISSLVLYIHGPIFLLYLYVMTMHGHGHDACTGKGLALFVVFYYGVD